MHPYIYEILGLIDALTNMSSIVPYPSSVFRRHHLVGIGIGITKLEERRHRFPLLFSVAPKASSASMPTPTPTSRPTPTPTPVGHHQSESESFEEMLEKVIYRGRFLTLLGVMGSLIGSILCFIKGSSYVVRAFEEYIVNQGTVILLLVEAVVMLVFGMGLFELFVSNLGTAKSVSDRYRSNLFGMFTLKERPKWLNIKTVNDLKTKLGHVIVMLLLIGVFEKSKKASINTPLDLLCFSASVLLSSSCLFLLSKLNYD